MLQELFELERRISAWLRPTYRGALFIFGMALGWPGKLFMFLILATLMLLAGAGPGAVLFLGFLGVAVGAGATAGTLHGLLRFLDRGGHPGTWLRWSLTILAYLIAVAFLTPKGPLSLDPTYFQFAAVLAAVAACCLTLLDDRRPSRPSAQRYRLLQSRERLWTSARLLRARLRGGAALGALQRSNPTGS